MESNDIKDSNKKALGPNLSILIIPTEIKKMRLKTNEETKPTGINKNDLFDLSEDDSENSEVGGEYGSSLFTVFSLTPELSRPAQRPKRRATA